MITREELKETIKSVKKIGGHLKLQYIPKTDLNSTQRLNELYYGGQRKIEIGKFYHNYWSKMGDFVEITDNNFEAILDEVYLAMKNNIASCLFQAMENMGLDDTDLKYFDRNLELYKKFKAEVLKLKKLDK
jgi:hypothetical protein